MRHINDWPLWLQLLVAIPNAILATYLLWIWWPKNRKEANRFTLVATAYCLLVYLFFHFFG